MDLVSFAEAEQALGVKMAGFFSPSTKRFKGFVFKGKGFDLEGYQKKQNLLEMAKAGAGLFVEYMVHHEGWSYKQVAELSTTNESQLRGGQIGDEVAMRILVQFARKEPMLIERFDSYYFFSPKRYNIKKLEKVAKQEGWIKKWK